MNEDMKKTVNTIETDILILGSGAAGCGAAIGAREHGATVTMLDKGKIESSGCLGGGNDHFMAVLNIDGPNDTKEAFVDFYKGPTSGYTPKMIGRWVDAMPVMIDVLEKIGVEFETNPDGSWLRTVGFGQPGAWFICIKNGQLIKRRLAKKVRSLGVDILDYIMVTRLLTSNGRITGVTGFNVLDGTFCVIRAKAVIMALGNSANRVTTNSTGNPFNTWHSPYNTGSQYVLAYESGARLVNLDLKQQATLLPKGFGCAGMNGINSVGAHEINALGQRFMGKYHSLKENGPRRNQILGTHQEMIEGKGPPFHMDMRHCDPEEVAYLQYVLMPGDKATFLDYAEQKGINFQKYPMEVELSEIELSGMLATDDNFETTVKGLYNGCVFYTFSGSMCSGYIAAKQAAERIGSKTQLIDLEPEKIKAEKNRVFHPMTVNDGISYENFERAIRQVMSYYMGFIRNQAGMENALEKLDFIATYANRLQADNYRELMRANEAVHLLKTCRLSTQSTMERKESGRALYRRSDYPELNENFNRVLSIWQESGSPKLAWV
ncbi:FAD-binding protein [Desulfobacula sp.]|uniref:FAD-binding protein n=1 Tax=Desulfobacula sp. TaxID=2593537 RepID=UPI00260D3499|nr:FAD-binding protein [Desulfobacula sp.]